MGTANQAKTLSGNLLLPNSTDDFEEEQEYVYQNFKILDIRKNEHFGDILMFSNERSPLCAIVKSRKAELFYLKKSDAIEISKSYPQIWQKLTKKSLFNMKQIRRLMAKIIHIFRASNGLSIQNQNQQEKVKESNISQNVEDDLQSIPSLSEVNTTKIKDTINNVDNLTNLNTIKESEIGSEEESEEISEDNNSFSKSENSLNVQTLKTDFIKNNITKKNNDDIESDSSCFTHKSLMSKKNTKKSKRSQFSKKTKSENNETYRVTHLTNRKVEFSDKCLSDDYDNQFLSKRANYTPYLPEEINNEIYPNEPFMKYNQKNNTKYIINNIINDNISVCSTEISFSISSKYENIDELSHYRYSKISKLRKKIKELLTDEEYCLHSDSDNHTPRGRSEMKKHNQFLKNSVSFDVFKIKKKSKTLKKCPSDEIFKKKKHNVNKKNPLKNKKK